MLDIHLGKKCKKIHAPQYSIAALYTIAKHGSNLTANRMIGKENILHIYDELLFSHEKE